MPDVDYDALAQQHGGAAAPAGVDYDALAKQHGGISGDVESHRIVPGQPHVSEFEQEHPSLAKIIKGIGMSPPLPGMPMELPGSGAMLAPQAIRGAMNVFPKSKLLLKAFDYIASLIPHEAPTEAPSISPEEYYRGQSVPAEPAPSATTPQPIVSRETAPQPVAATTPATPTAKVQPIRPEPPANTAEPPAPKPATGAATANAMAKADRFVQAIQKFNSDFPLKKLTADELEVAGDEEKSMLTRGLQQGGYLKNTEKFTDSSFPYILQRLKAAETAARQTIKPPKGFSMGAMKNQ